MQRRWTFILEKLFRVQSLVGCHVSLKDISESNTDDLMEAWMVKFQKEAKYLLGPFDTLQ